MLLHAKRAKALGPDFDPDDYMTKSHADTQTSRQVSGEVDEEFQSISDRSIPRRALFAGGASAVAAGAFLALGLARPASAQTYSTRRGEIRLVPLVDGATMTLNTATTAKMRRTGGNPDIELVEGEALFDIAHTVVRPLVVSVGTARLRSIGTSFVIRRLVDRSIQALIRRGVVEIETAATVGREPIRVTANNRVVIEGSGSIRITGVSADEIERELTWREGMLSFEDVPLKDAARQFARYNGTRILFAPPALGDETVTGLFAFNDPGGFARSVALSQGLRTEAGRQSVTLSRMN
ncbi:FecR domain-containing protein [Sphingobium sp. AN558]|uniref:FecR family protein n=1 Tax=Sphingobium sp. AN558 TaxID=3133442 RepID=UPI0030BE8CF0